MICNTFYISSPGRQGDAMTFEVIDENNNSFILVILFVQTLSFRQIVHEAFHVYQIIRDREYLNATKDTLEQLREPQAYLYDKIACSLLKFVLDCVGLGDLYLQ
jgi:hypothetical protein